MVTCYKKIIDKPYNSYNTIMKNKNMNYKNNNNKNNKSKFKKNFYSMSKGNTCVAETKLEVLT